MEVDVHMILRNLLSRRFGRTSRVGRKVRGVVHQTPRKQLRRPSPGQTQRGQRSPKSITQELGYDFSYDQKNAQETSARVPQSFKDPYDFSY